MKKVLSILFCLAIVSSLMIAQERTGNITGIVVDQEGNPLPGVTLTLTGPSISPIPSVSSAEGRFRFLSLAPSKLFVVKAELQGFKTRTETGIVVNVNFTANIRIVMEQGKLEEQVTVVAVTPVVQAKKTQVTTTVNYDQLQSLPSARDPWVVLQLAPSVFIDRENIGGVESGQQSGFMAKGSTTQEWTMDGMQITDRNSNGSPGYFDFDAFEEMNISTGMLDVEHRDPGVVVNLVTRRGGNKTSLGGRFFYTNEKFQSVISPADLTSLGIQGYNHAIDLKDFGFNAGGPVLKDKIWWWAAYGVQQVQTINLLNVRDDTYLNNYTGKVNFQLIPENRLELFYQAGDKKKYGRSSSNQFPPGWNQHSDYYFGNPTFKLQDEHSIGDNIFLSVRYGWANAGFGMWPANDEKLQNYMWYDYTNDLVTQSYTWFYSSRPHPYFVGQVQLFSDNLFGTGTSHEIKLGGEVNNSSRTYTGGYPGNFYVYSNYNIETVDWNLDGKVDVVKNLAGAPTFSRIYITQSDQLLSDGTKRLAFYFSDAIQAGRFNVNIGLRADWAKPFLDGRTMQGLWTKNADSTDKYRQYYNDLTLKLFAPDALAAVAPLMPIKSQPGITPIKLFWFFSPRLGITYDLFGDGKTVLKAAYSLYPGQGLGTAYTTPFGLTGRSMNFWWADTNADKKAQLNELYWASYATSTRPVYRAFNDDGSFAGNWTREKGYNWNGWDPDNPMALTKSASYIDIDNWKTSLTHEVFLSIEREIIQDFGVSLSYTWKRMGRYSWSLSYYPAEFYPTLNNHLRNVSDYELGGTIPNQLVDPATGKTLDPKEAAGKPWYVLKYLPETGTTNYSKTVMMDPGRYDRYWGIDLVLNKRLSHKWMMNGSFTYQMQNSFYGANGIGYGPDPTNLWAYEGQIYGVSMGGTSGKVARLMFSRWMLKLTGLYQLPWDLNASFTVSGHEGSFVSYSFGVQDRTLPNPQDYSRTMQMTAYDNKTRLPNVWTVSIKLEKAIKLGDNGRLYFSGDIFNLINSRVLMRQYDYAYGSYRFTGGPANPVPYSWTAGATTSGAKNEIMNPLLFRAGVRFQI